MITPNIPSVQLVRDCLSKNRSVLVNNGVLFIIDDATKLFSDLVAGNIPANQLKKPFYAKYLIDEFDYDQQKDIASAVANVFEPMGYRVALGECARDLGILYICP